MEQDSKSVSAVGYHACGQAVVGNRNSVHRERLDIKQGFFKKFPPGLTALSHLKTCFNVERLFQHIFLLNIQYFQYFHIHKRYAILAWF